MSRSDRQQVGPGRRLIVKVARRMQFWSETAGGGDDSRIQWPSKLSGGKQLGRTPHGWIQTSLQSNRCMKGTDRSHHLFGLRNSAPERRFAVDRLASSQRRQNQV